MKKPKDINYWAGFEGLAGFNRLDAITKSDWQRPKDAIYFAIPRVMSNLSFNDTLPSAESTSKKLVFRFYEKLETGLIYKFVGWD